MDLVMLKTWHFPFKDWKLYTWQCHLLVAVSNTLAMPPVSSSV